MIVELKYVNEFGNDRIYPKGRNAAAMLRLMRPRKVLTKSDLKDWTYFGVEFELEKVKQPKLEDVIPNLKGE